MKPKAAAGLKPLDLLFSFIGIIMLFAAACTLVLICVGLVSHQQQKSPLYWRLLWVVAYLAVVGLGVLKQKKWAVILLFGPGVLAAILLFRSLAQGQPAPTVAIETVWAFAMLAVPIALCARWKSLTWL